MSRYRCGEASRVPLAPVSPASPLALTMQIMVPAVEEVRKAITGGVEDWGWSSKRGTRIRLSTARVENICKNKRSLKSRRK